MKGPIGRIGTPFNRLDCYQFRVGEIVLYIEADLLSDLPAGSDHLKIYMGDYGTWRIRIDR